MNTETRTQERFTSELQIYLHEIAETHLLSASEERDLAQRIKDGQFDARDRLVRANLRLVVNIARGYLGRGVGLEDLISEGNLGLLRAAEGFDGTMGIRFSTYASYWIKQAIRRIVMNQGKPIRLPAYMITLLTKWRRATVVLTERLGHAPSPEEVGRELRLSKKRLSVVEQALRINRLTPCAGDEDENLLNQVVVDHQIEAPEILAEADEIERLTQRLDTLKEREAKVIRMRYGLSPYAPMTLNEVGEQLGLTRERIRQLEKQAMQQLMQVA